MNAVLTAVPDFFSQTLAYREFLKQSVIRDLKTKYKRNVLGYVWTMLHPLAMMAILSVVFSQLLRVGIEDYAIFLFCGLLPWNYLQSTILMSLGTIRASARLFSQVPVPKFLFVLSVACSNFVNLLFAIVPLVALCWFFDHSLTYRALLFPIMLIPIFLFTIGIALIVSTFNIFFNDTNHLTEVFLSAIYFLTPILYQQSMLPPEYQWWFEWNPLVAQIELFRGVFYANALPDPWMYGTALLHALVALVIGLLFFRKLEDKFLYYV
jgi:ABC-type polysaccharide/polyol phosphate export permease